MKEQAANKDLSESSFQKVLNAARESFGNAAESVGHTTSS